MKTLLKWGVLALGVVAAGCHHAEPRPDDQPQQQPPPPSNPQPPPPAPTSPPAPTNPQVPSTNVPVHGDPGRHAGSVNEVQAEQVAIAFAAEHGMPGAYKHRAQFKNKAWVFKLRAAAGQPGVENKMDVVVGEDGQVRSWAFLPYGSPGWNQAD